MSVGVYIRVSTYDQNSDGQRAEITRWLEAHGHDLEAVQWFEDKETGATLERPGFTALQEAIFSGSVKTIVVWKLDRIARSHKDGINLIGGWCESGLRVVSVTQQIDLSGTIGQIIAGVLFGIAQIELENIKERQAVGIAVAKAKGVYKGRKPGTNGGKPERARTLKAKGLKAEEIAKALGVTERSVFRYLKQE